MWCTALLPVHQDSIARDPGTGPVPGYFPEGGVPYHPPPTWKGGVPAV